MQFLDQDIKNYMSTDFLVKKAIFSLFFALGIFFHVQNQVLCEKLIPTCRMM